MIDDILRPYESDNPISKALLGIQLRLALIKESEDYQPFCNIVAVLDMFCKSGEGYDVNAVKKFFSDLDIKTLREAKVFSDGLEACKFEKLFKIVHPVLEIDTSRFKEITGNSILEHLAQLFPFADYHFGDTRYRLIPEKELENILIACPTNRFRYISEERDCEDFSRILRGWLSESGCGNLSVGYFEFVKGTWAHASIIVLVEKDDGKLGHVFVEPMTKKVVEYEDIKARVIWF